ncbi:protein HIRA homolog isoform X2 [Anthonomus grandis grandis]|uniref:protein HIRA homolog isoform X2 n=1 Tax=Anthonomus grandis grandis TaxID=2921223 RepID=UPI0021660248|nr:protein HIRA homolog isoform X2 [Anthonomus grandis grandis]
MQFFKPAWINHDGNKPIFSVDVHPKGNRFATGGQGGSGGRIVIWNLNPVINQNDEDDPKVAKMLCQMDNHTGCVNVVRWSNNGHYLASGSDDKLIMIWRLTSEGSSTIFGSSQINVETWKCVNTLNLHEADVLDLAWAPHDGWLASGSIDNTVIVWNAHKFPEKVAHLTNHTGLVKGVTWDPVGKYLASQSDDKSLRIWRTSDWNQQEVITDPFIDCSATTHVLRCSWSPDGQYLVSAHAMNGGGPTAQIIEREGWKHEKDFVGHRKAITCVRFNSNIFKKPSRDSPSKSTQYCCLAIGSRDRSISVWLTSLKRPLVVVKELFEDSILDISWSSRGDFLLACSGDGTVACIMFEETEIGIPLTMDEKNALYERIYHRSLQSSWNTNVGSSQIIEDPEILLAIEEVNKKTKPLNIEPPEINEPPKPQDIIIASPNLNQSVLVPANKQVETRLPSGKRRITPMLLTPSGNVNDSLTPTKQSTPTPCFSSSTPTKSTIIVEKRTGLSNASQVISPSPSEPALRKVETLKTVVSTPPGIQINQLMCVEVPGDQPITKVINILDPLDLNAAPMITKEAENVEIQVNNNCHKISSTQSLSKIVVCKATTNREPIWETFLGSAVRTIGSTRKYVVACCEDCTINIYDIKCGARLTPPLLIDDLVCCTSLSQAGFLLVLTKTGLMYLWDLNSKKSILNRISIRSLLSGRATVKGISLTTSNEPILTLSDGRAYSYSIDFQTWMYLSNPLDPVSRAAVSVMKNMPGNLPLASFQREMFRYRSTNSTLPPGVTLSFIETQIPATKVLQSVTEFRNWLFVQVNHLLEKGPECRLKYILDDLMGPSHGRGVNSKLNGSIMGIPRRKLLEDILGIIKSKLPWQRLYKEYKEQLDEIE